MANENGLKIDVKPEVAKGSYSNLAIITHSHTEFILDFASMLPGLAKPEVHNRIIMNPEHAKRQDKKSCGTTLFAALRPLIMTPHIGSTCYNVQHRSALHRYPSG